MESLVLAVSLCWTDRGVTVREELCKLDFSHYKLKAIVHPKIKIMSLITHPHVVPNYFTDVLTFLGQ